MCNSTDGRMKADVDLVKSFTPVRFQTFQFRNIFHTSVTFATCDEFHREWKFFCLEFFLLKVDCNALFIIEENSNLTCIATALFSL